MQIIVNDILVDYADQGSGPVLLCVHGWMHSQTTYKQLAEQLDKDFRVVSIDLPNFGKSGVAEAVQSIDDYANFLEDFREKLKIRDYVLIGHSMGGQIAIRGVSNGVLKPRKLVLIGAAGVRDERKIYKVFLQAASKVLRHVVPKSLKAKFYARIGSDYSPDLAEIHKKIIQKTLTTDIQADASNITTRTLLIYGENDTSTPPRMGKKLARLIKNSSLRFIENEQHWPHQTSARKVADFIREFSK